MTTSNSDRCTRISPSAVLDDRLDGKDLEWARDHLRRCEACRERVEDFREMLMRVGRLPKATVGATAMDEAYNVSVPDRLREEGGIRSYEISPADTSRLVPPIGSYPSAIHPEVGSIPDLMNDLEREIFRDQPTLDHPRSVPAIPDPIYPTMAPPETEPEEMRPMDPEPVNEAAADTEQSAPPDPVSAAQPQEWREVPLDSHRDTQEPGVAPVSDESEWTRLLERIANAPETDEQDVASPPPVAPVAPLAAAVGEHPAHRNVIFEGEPAVAFEAEETPSRPGRRINADTVMRLAVGFGAAAFVLLAALLYEGGYLLKSHPVASATATATVRPSAKPSTSARPSARPSVAASASQPPATVLSVLGNGVAGDSVFRIRPGTAVAGYTRLVFDMHGAGLPSMVVTQIDSTHLQVIFKKTTLAQVPVNGIRSYQVAAVEPGVQAGPDATFIIDLNRPVRVTAFTLPATGSYAWRLVVDLHTI